MDLNDKVAIITGAAQGFGKAFSEALLIKGAKVCLSDVAVEKGNETTSQFEEQFGKDKVLFVECDVSSSDDFSELFKKAKEKFGQIDIVVNNAGISNEKNWRKTIGINLTGVIEGTLLGIEYMSKSTGGNGGVIVNIASAAGLMAAFLSPAYVASKHGVVGYTRSWAQNPSNASNGLRFTCLCPTFADTNMIKITDESSLDKQALAAMQKEYGILKVETIVKGFMELVTDESNNGSVLKISPEGFEYVFTN